MKNGLVELLATRSNKKWLGIYSVCSAHPWVVETAMRQAIQDHSPLLIEATSNQVNQFGGYTGMQPAGFRQHVLEIAERVGFDPRHLILGGDHLGPNPWRHLPAREAMRNANEMVAAYVRAEFSKIHLDASMACSDDTVPLSDELMAERAAQMCLAAEQASNGNSPVYVIGTEVPTPGGATESLHTVAVTRRSAAERTIATHHHAFAKAGVSHAWPRVIALVVQPGVEFDHDRVVDYIPENATDLCQLLQDEPGLVFEAHSTDYQRPQAYKELLRDGFGILKVGPALTFAMREALYALADIERLTIAPEKQSHLPDVIESVMLAHPQDWKSHYHGDDRTKRLLRTHSYGDRVRYYWGNPEIQEAVNDLMANLSCVPIPEILLSRYLPNQYANVRAGKLQSKPLPLVLDKIRDAILPYALACAASPSA